MTRLLFAETPTNPLTEVCDIAALADIAHEAGALLAVDNCFCLAGAAAPDRAGRRHRDAPGTKYLDGQGRVMAGALCASEQLVLEVPAGAEEPGMVLSPVQRLGRAQGPGDAGPAHEGAKRAALELARWLEAHPAVARVYYPGLPSHPAARAGDAQMNGCGGAVVSFDVRASLDAGARARLPRHRRDDARARITTNLGDTKTSSPPGQHLAWQADRSAAPGRRHRPGLIRVAVGLEHSRRHHGRPERGWPPKALQSTAPFARPDASAPLRPVADRLHPPGQHPLGLYPWGFARANGGDFILRIEDTDQERSTQAAVDVIIEGMAGWA